MEQEGKMDFRLSSHNTRGGGWGSRGKGITEGRAERSHMLGMSNIRNGMKLSLIEQLHRVYMESYLPH